MHILDLANLGRSERFVIYSALLHSVKTNTGIGFHNCDQESPAYCDGRNGDTDYNKLGDSPAHNELYQMMKAIAPTLVESGEFAVSDLVTDWATF